MTGRLSSDVSVQRMRTWSLLLVTAIAAVVSYLHIEALAAAHGQDALNAHLIPLSVDGTVAAASMDMLGTARRRGGRPSWIARTMLGLGVAATLAANVASGWPHGLIGATAAGWPALAFIGSVEMVLLSIRKAARASPAVAADEARRGHRAVRPVKAGAAITSKDVAAQLGVSERTARRRLAALRPPAAAAEAGQ